MPLHLEITRRSVIVVKGSNFIWETEISTDVCDDLLRYYDECTYLKKREYTGIKHSEDLHLHLMLAQTEECLDKYLRELARVMDAYFEVYPMAGELQCNFASLFNIQRYPPGGGYKGWHFERGNHRENRERHLVWMTFLTDNADGGTEFQYQDVYIPAVKGKTVIWPAEWTHTHRGRVCDTEKTIITGWVDLE